MSDDHGTVDEGLVPLTHFLDSDQFDRAAAITLESDRREDLYPVVYVRRGGLVVSSPPMRTLWPHRML